ncbi:MAG TPA: AI-2E family transporter [Acidimicrobiales bacterium]
MEGPPADAVKLLRFTPFSVIRAVAMVAGTLLVLAVFRAATRPLGWLVVAVVGAALLGPFVALLQRALPRGLAVVVALLVAAAAFGAVTYVVVDDLSRELNRVQLISRRAAGEVERSERYGEFAREIHLRNRVNAFVDQLPDRLRGGTDVAAIQSAASRGVSFLITFVLLLFMLATGPKFIEGGLRQIDDEVRRARARTVLIESYGRFWRYVAATLGRAVLAGFFTYLVVQIADLPAPALLAVWVGAWSVVPAVGIVVGSLAVGLVAIPHSFSLAGWLMVLFIGYQVFDALVIEKRIDRSIMHLGSFGTFVAAAFGLEAYGLGGLIVTTLLAIFLAAVVRTITSMPMPTAVDEVLAGAG